MLRESGASSISESYRFNCGRRCLLDCPPSRTTTEYEMTAELNGKVAIVTGAGRNIGRAIALALARDGASIVVNARSNRAEADAVAREIEAAGGKAAVHIGDVADAAPVQAMADLAAKQFGRLDILVNNAALRREKPFAEMSYAEWREILDVTLDGTFHCVQAWLPALRQS